VIEFVRAASTVGVGRLLELRRAHRVAWHGILEGFYTSRTVQALLNVGFFDSIEEHGRVDARTFAESRGLDPDILVALADSLAALRLLDRRGGMYSLTPKGQVVTGTARGWFDLTYGYEDVFHHLEDLLTRTSRYGQDVHRRSAFVARGSGEVERQFYFPLAAEIVRKRGFTKVLDLGCGDGTFLRTLCQRDPRVVCHGIDLAPEAIAEGKERAREEGLSERVDLLTADVRQIATLPASWRDLDVAFTFFVLHEVLYHGEAGLLELLGSFRRLFPRVPLVVFEAIRPTPEQMRRRPGMSVQYFLFHDLTHQKPVGRAEWRALFKRAGFGTVEERWLPFAGTSIFTCK
jgi:SAM-dependent methyltransferase